MEMHTCFLNYAKGQKCVLRGYLAGVIDSSEVKIICKILGRK
jgi:hypothetical protein